MPKAFIEFNVAFQKEFSLLNLVAGSERRFEG